MTARGCDPALWSLIEVAQAIRQGDLSSVAATEACLRRIETWQPAINAFISVQAEAALETARAADADLARGHLRGPLHGVPLACKDVMLRRGHPVSAGSKALGQDPATETATVVERLEGAGAIMLGALNLTEWIAYTTGENPNWGDCRNPWNRDRITGGSSSGSGASVAARLAFGALASDTGGSGRTPAAFCGVLGLKPTYGRVSRHGAVPRAWSLDCIGMMARTAADCARLLGVMAGSDSRDPSASALPVPDYEADLERPPSGTRIGIGGGYFAENLTPDVATALEQAVQVLAAAGAPVNPAPVPDPRPFFALSDAVMKCEAAAAHARRMKASPGDFSMPVFARNEGGLHIPATRYLEALAMRGRLSEAFVETAFAGADVLLLPAVAFSAPTFEDVRIDQAGAVPDLVSSITRFLRPFNYLGLPALTVPCGFSKDDMPLAFQLVGRPFGESRLLALAHAYQKATNWHHRQPPEP
jgi:aspartyl-tRNA(Asn)/glutamyl-tRNA(Gln) amidotransferase subunit A